MGVDIHQGLIIEKLNAYLEAQNLPFKMNKDGICHGLATLQIKYALEGNSKKFKDILMYIVDGKKRPGIRDEDIDVFAIQAAVTFNPQNFDLKYHQRNSIEMLSINNQKLKSSFDLSLVAKDSAWQQVFQELDIKENEGLIVSSINHTISIQKSNNQYTVYDPNYSEGYKFFKNEKELVNELHRNVFHYDDGNMGLVLQVIRNPAAEKRTFPDIKSIYNRYLPDINVIAKVGGEIFTTVNNIAQFCNYKKEDIQYLLENKPFNAYEAAGRAVGCNNPHILEPLLEEINNKQRLVLLEVVLRCGGMEAKEALLKNDKFKSFHDQFLTFPNAREKAIIWAAEGGNPLILKEYIQYYKNNLGEEADKKLYELIKSDKDPIMKAIDSGSFETVGILIAHIEMNGCQMDNVSRMRYLAESIRHNKLHLSAMLLDLNPKITVDQLNTISMSTLAVERTNIALLSLLKDKGMIFSDTAQKTIDRKNKNSLTFIDSLGVAVAKFTDFFKESLSKSDEKGISFDTNLFKKKLSNLKENNLDEVSKSKSAYR